MSLENGLKPIKGLHHVTAIASDPQRTLDFYTRVLGLRFVKKTVNFDDPGTYHFYFGDDGGTPGTILTFFPWPHARRGTAGAGETVATAFSIPAGAARYWRERLAGLGVVVREAEPRFGETVVAFADPDGMVLELVEDSQEREVKAPRFSDVPAEYAIRGFYGVTLLEQSSTGTAAVLGLMGFQQVGEENGRLRFSAGGDALGNHIDVVLNPTALPGRMGAGTVHHIAFRSEDFEDQKGWLAAISRKVGVSPVMERDYFRSIYYREPGGVLFELATDIPGFAVDEPVEALGEALRVPEWFDAERAKLAERLPVVVLHKAGEEVAK